MQKGIKNDITYNTTIQINMSYLFLVFLNMSGMLQMDFAHFLPVFPRSSQVHEFEVNSSSPLKKYFYTHTFMKDANYFACVLKSNCMYPTICLIW